MGRFPSDRLRHAALCRLKLWVSTTPPHGPEMSVRARAYLVVAAYRHLATGATMLLLPQTFDGPAFNALFRIGTEWFWTLTMLAGGLHLAYAAYRGCVRHARVALGISVTVTAAWAGAFAIVVLDGFASWFAFIFLSAVALKDLLVCAQPMRSPFEDLQAVFGAPPPGGG